MGIQSAVQVLAKLRDPNTSGADTGYGDASAELLIKLARAAERAGVRFSVALTIKPPGRSAVTLRSTLAGICWSSDPDVGGSERRLVEGLVHDSTGLDTLAQRIVDEIEGPPPSAPTIRR